MHKRILRAVTVAFAGVAIAVPAATAAGNSQRANIADKLHEIGAWTAPSAAKATRASRRASIKEKLAEVGAWAVPTR